MVLNSLAQSEEEEDIHGEDVVHAEERSKHSSKSKDQSFERMGIFSNHSER